MSHKIIGYLLLFIGLGLMFFAFTGMCQTFVHKKPVVQVVALKPLALQTQYGTIQADSSIVNSVLNLALFALFMFFIAGLGGKIATTGNNMIKTERICETLLELKKENVLTKEDEIKKL